MRFIVYIMTCIVAMALSSNAINAQNGTYRHDVQYPFLIVSEDTVSQAPVFSDKDFYDYSISVQFEVSKSVISSQNPFLKLYNEVVLPSVNERHLQLRKVFIRGAASPEGPYEFNRKLGKDRSMALLTELRRNLQHQYLNTDIEINSVTEDYGLLCLQMEEAKDADYATVRKIYDDCGGNEQICKKHLMALDGGKLWQRMLKEYFPRLRAARLIMWFSEPDAMQAPKSIRLDDIEMVSSEMEVPRIQIGDLNIELEDVPAVELPRQRLMAVRTNLMHDFFYMPQFGMAFSPNIQLEFYPRSGRLTYNVGMTWGTDRRWSSSKFWQVRDFQFELRRYFKSGAAYTGSYLGAYAHGDKYGIGLSKTKGWEGEGGGAGVTLGYVLPLNKKQSLKLEFMLAAGFYMTYYDPYVYGNPLTGTQDGDYYYDYLGSASKFKKRNHNTLYAGPTNFGIQLTYDIIYRKHHAVKKGGGL